MSTPTPAPAAVPVEAGEPVAWLCTRRLDGDKAVFDIPCTTANLAYVKAHPRHDWTPLYAAPVPRQAAPADEALLRQAVETMTSLVNWAGSRCPCENETPDPCTLCGVTVASGEGCKAVSAIIPAATLTQTRAALAALSARLADSAIKESQP